MKITRIFAISLCIVFTSCSYTEGQRQISNSSADLGIKFNIAPKLLKTEEYGSFEEGGYHTIMQLAKQDCDKLSRKLNNATPAPNLADFERLLQERSIKIGEVKYQSQETVGGDFLVYALDTRSCILYNWEHTE
jgi:hypothetical protein